MSEVEYDEVEPKDLVENPINRPYKLYAAMLSAFLTTFLMSGLDLPLWAKALILAAIQAIAVFLIPNPLAWKKGVLGTQRNQDTLF